MDEHWELESNTGVKMGIKILGTKIMIKLGIILRRSIRITSRQTDIKISLMTPVPSYVCDIHNNQTACRSLNVIYQSPRQTWDLTTDLGWFIWMTSMWWLFPISLHSTSRSSSLGHLINPSWLKISTILITQRRHVMPGYWYSSASMLLMTLSTTLTFSRLRSAIWIRTQRFLDLNTPQVSPWSGIQMYSLFGTLLTIWYLRPFWGLVWK